MTRSGWKSVRRIIFWQPKVPMSRVYLSATRVLLSGLVKQMAWLTSQRKKVGRPESILLIRVLARVAGAGRERESCRAISLRKYWPSISRQVWNKAGVSASNGEMKRDEATHAACGCRFLSASNPDEITHKRSGDWHPGPGGSSELLRWEICNTAAKVGELERVFWRWKGILSERADNGAALSPHTFLSKWGLLYKSPLLC